MSEQVLVIPTAEFHTAGLFQGFTSEVERYLPRLLTSGELRYLSRDLAEQDPSWKQLIPYVVLRFQGKIFHYLRAGGGEKRLHAKRSIGIGGHICSDDGHATTDAYHVGMLRELNEEVILTGEYTERCVGLINDDRTPVGQVHLGIVHIVDLQSPEVSSRESNLIAGGFAEVKQLRAEREGFETWSQYLLEAAWVE